MAEQKSDKKSNKSESPQDDQETYQVLARKYRPQSFDDLIGQEALVRTLSNAIDSNRLAHAYILTGVRGIGKTSTARIIAKALNCPDAKGNPPPTLTPDLSSPIAKAIEEGRHVDVLEMDAASRTGVGDIRELIEGVQYKPVEAPFKVYIIDEVHMLSTQAFNALLKTLEEPPEHVKFIFATTEIRKVPITVLSRCQRFDLRRVETSTLAEHIINITEKEGGEISEEAALIIAKAADGSVRDALSLLDQALVISNKDITTDGVAEMLGLVDISQTYDLLEACLNGQAADAFTILNDMYTKGGDPLVIIQDLLNVTHFITRLKITPETAKESASEVEVTRGTALSDTMAMSILARAWQVLLKAIHEVQTAPRPLAAAEMVLARLCYMANLPTPDKVIEQLAKEDPAPAVGTPTPPSPQPPAGTVYNQSNGGGNGTAAAISSQPAPQPAPSPQSHPQAMLATFEDVIALIEEKREMILLHHLTDHIRLVRFDGTACRIEFRPLDDAPADLSGNLIKHLSQWTGQKWHVSVSNAEGQPTVSEQRANAYAKLEASVKEHPLVAKAFELFEDGKITAINPKDPEKK